ncbi:MAG: tetratricopeptide repeat protein [Promethearchaeota archaeon]
MMKLSNLTIRDLITSDEKLTFLAGAGCSIEPPSCLPAGRAMMDAIINYICAEAEIGKIKKLEQLRFEALIEIVRDYLDPELKIIDFYGECENPNIQHFFLVEMIKKGNFVITTNFDFLIEYALRHSGVFDDNIIVVITREDFEKYKFPDELYSQGKKVLYKIHGSTKNIITGDDTKEYLVATIQAFGTNKEGLNVFQLEPFKRDLFVNITEGRSLIIMGYSGSDDFDIVPTLKALKNLKNVIWINYSQEIEMGSEKIYEINEETDQFLNKLEGGLQKVTQILFDVHQMDVAKHVYRIDVNTSKFATELLQKKPNLKTTGYSIELDDWLRKNIEEPGEFSKEYIASRIYLSFNEYNDALRCAEEALRLSDGERDYLFLLNYIGMVYYEQRKFAEALQRFEEIITYRKSVGEMYGGDSILFYNMGMICYKLKNYTKALNLIGESLQIERSALKYDEEMGDLPGKTKCFNIIGLIDLEQKNYSQALERFESALKISESLADLVEKAISYNNLGDLYGEQEDYQRALKYYKLALDINEKYGYLSNKAIVLRNIGVINELQDNYPTALENYEKALEIFGDMNDIINKAELLNHIGEIHYYQENFAKALEKYINAFSMIEQISNLTDKSTFDDDFRGVYKSLDEIGYKYEVFEPVRRREDIIIKGNILNNMGQIHQYHSKDLNTSTKLEEAFDNNSELLKVLDEGIQKGDIKFGDPSGLAYCYYRIGLIYDHQGRYDEALSNYEEALQIFKQKENFPLGIVSEHMIIKIKAHNNVGEIYRFKKKFKDALDQFEKVLMFTDMIGEKNIKTSCLYQIALIFQEIKQYEEALKFYGDSLKIAEELGDLNMEVLCLEKIGKINELQGNYPEALKKYEEMQNIASKQEDATGKFLSLGHIAEIHLRNENFPEALKQFEEALKIAEDAKNLELKFHCLYSIAEIHKIQERYEEALKEFIEVLLIAELLQKDSLKSMTLIHVGEIYRYQKKYQIALKKFEEAIQITTRLGDLEGKFQCLLNFSDIHMMFGNLQVSKKALEQAFQIVYARMGMHDETPKGPPQMTDELNQKIQDVDKRWKQVNKLLKES